MIMENTSGFRESHQSIIVIIIIEVDIHIDTGRRLQRVLLQACSWIANKYGLNSSYILVSFRAYQSIVNGEAEGCSSWHDIFSRKTHPETQRAAARKSGSWPTARLGESTSVEFPIDQITGFKVVKFTLWLFNIAMV